MLIILYLIFFVSLSVRFVLLEVVGFMIVIIGFVGFVLLIINIFLKFKYMG